MSADPTARPPTAEGSEAGFTLVELLMAIFLFGVAMTALIGVFIAAAHSIGEQRLRAAATRVASDHLETLRSVPFDALGTHAGQTTTTTPDGRVFTIDTAVTRIDAATGQPDPAGAVQQITATVGWTFRGAPKSATYTTAMAPDDAAPAGAAQAIGTVTMFPSPTTTDASGTPLQDIEVTVPLQGFPADTLVQLSWANAGMADGAKTLTSTNGLNWRGTVGASQVRAAIVAGAGEVEFAIQAGGLSTIYTLAVRVATASPPVISAASVTPSPVTVSAPVGGRTCDDRNQCENTVDVTFAVTTNLDADPARGNSVIVQYQLHDGTFHEVPLTHQAGEWRLTVRRNTTKFLVGTARPFRFTAIRADDSATATSTVNRDVVRL